MNRLLRLAGLIAVSFLLGTLSTRAESDKVPQTLFKNLMEAVISDNHDAFVAECDPTMKAAMTKAVLDNVSSQIAPRAGHGYDADYLGEMKKQGYVVHLWRLRFKDSGDDLLATLSLKDGKVGGFYLK